MYLVANTSRKELSIGDLDIIISPKQALDLDKIKTKIRPEDSKDLKTCIKKRWVKIAKTDRIQKRKTKIVEKVIDKYLLGDIRKILKEEIKKQLSTDNIKTIPDDPRITEILNTLTRLSKEKFQTIIDHQDIEENVLDEEVLSQIHALAVDKKIKETDGSISYKNEKVDNNITDNVSELEGLLG